MSLKAETFYAIQCDFPECGDLYEGYEYTYSADPGAQADDAREDGWLIDSGVDDLDYCPLHVVEAKCAVVVDGGGDEWCPTCGEYGEMTHMVPMENTFANRVSCAIQRVINAHQYKIRDATRELAAFATAYAGGRRMENAHTQAVQSIVEAYYPDASMSEIYRIGRTHR